jgi:hypothetical protein
MAEILATLGWGLALWRMFTNRPRLAATTLRTAGRWALGGALLWSFAWGARWALLPGGGGWQDALWYLSAVVALCPAIAVLGARRPGIRVWTWFVLWPLVAVLSWPAAAALWTSPEAPALRVPLPLLIGFAVVLAMGAGNYLPTRYALSAVLLAVAECLVVAPVSETAPPLDLPPETLRLWGTAALALAVLWGERQSRRPTLAPSPLDRVWFDFRDAFGIVWARRLCDQINQRAEAEQWLWRLTDDGFVPFPPRPPHQPRLPPDDPRLEHALRGRLQRFVDPEWIDQRLSDSPRTQ